MNHQGTKTPRGKTERKMRYRVYSLAGSVDGSTFASLMVLGKGTVDVDLRGAVASIKCLYVVPLFRRKGVGAALFREAIHIARLHRKVALNFTVRKQNLEAIAFYRKQGAICCCDAGEDWWFAVPLQWVGSATDAPQMARSAGRQHRDG